MDNTRLINTNDIKFLTNQTCEDIGIVSSKDMKQLNLPRGTFDGGFYPLTKQESAYISDEELEMAEAIVLMGYSGIFDGKKYLIPTIEVDYSSEPCDRVQPFSQAKAENERLRLVAERVATATGGFFGWRETPEAEWDGRGGKFFICFLIPFDYAFAHAKSYDEWVVHLAQVIIS